MSYIKDKVIIITTASCGIGEATALYLEKQGASVVLAARMKTNDQGTLGTLIVFCHSLSREIDMKIKNIFVCVKR